MARKVKKLEVSVEIRQALVQKYKAGGVGICRRSQMVLLKLEGYRSKEIGRIVGCCEMSVNNWIRRFELYGMPGLQTKAGQGRKTILTDSDLPLVKAAVQQERQRLSKAKSMIENDSGKRLSNKTLSRFLKLITAVTNE